MIKVTLDKYAIATILCCLRACREILQCIVNVIFGRMRQDGERFHYCSICTVRKLQRDKTASRLSGPLKYI